MRITLFKHALVAAAASLTVVLVAGGIASAHIHTDPIAIQAGVSATVAFEVEHGCDGSPTTGMTFQVPVGITDAVGVEKEGWTSTVTADTIEFTGGPLDPEQADQFALAFTAPDTAGDLSFPIIQTCEQGELAWIERIVEGEEEPERPAPVVKITEGPPTAEDLAPEHEEGEATEGTEGTVVITGTVAEGDDDDSSSTGTIVLVVVIAALIIGGGGVALARRRGSAPKS